MRLSLMVLAYLKRSPAKMKHNSLTVASMIRRLSKLLKTDSGKHSSLNWEDRTPFLGLLICSGMGKMMPHIYLILAGLATSRVVSLSLGSPLTLTTITNVSVSDVANCNSLPDRMLLIRSFKHLGSLLAARATYICDANQYGNPPLNQCREVLKQMSNQRNFKSYGDSTIAGKDVDIPLPAYYFSSKLSRKRYLAQLTLLDDRSCVIEVFTRREGQIDVMEPIELRKKVASLLNKCIKPSTQGYSPEGGIGSSLG